MPFLKDVGNFFNTVGNTIGGAVTGTMSDIRHIIGDVHSDIQGVFTGAKDSIDKATGGISTVSTTAIQSARDVLSKGVETAGGAIEDVSSAASSITESLSLPLVIGGLGAVYLLGTGKIRL